MRDKWREQMSEALTLVKGKDLPWENNRHGRMKWYLHPALTDRAMRSLVVFVQEIPPLSHTGKQRLQGGLVHYILEGRGYTVLNGVKHEWEAGDCVVFPILPNGVEYQHSTAIRKGSFVLSLLSLISSIWLGWTWDADLSSCRNLQLIQCKPRLLRRAQRRWGFQRGEAAALPFGRTRGFKPRVRYNLIRSPPSFHRLLTKGYPGGSLMRESFLFLSEMENFP